MSIADELALLANTKENLRVSLGLSKDVPFSQYASHIPYYAKVGTVFDFVNNQYSRGQLPVNLSDISEFIRLSSATMWEDGQLVEVGGNIPRISGEGLLIEPMATNYIPNDGVTDRYVGSSTSIVSDKDSGLGFKYTEFESSGKIRDDGYSFGYHFSPVPNSIAVQGGIASFYLKPAAGTRYLRFMTYPLYDTHPWNTTIDLNDFSIVREREFSFLGGEMLGGGWIRLSFMDNTYGSYRSMIIVLGQDGDDPRATNTWTAIPEGLTTGLAMPNRTLLEKPSSLINYYGTPATRTPDILNIPLLPSQSITGDWDAGVTYTVADNIATFTGHGYIRNITVEEL